MHNQKETARLIYEKGGDCLLQVKDNQKALHEILQKALDSTLPGYGPPEKGQGRIEQRGVEVLPANAMTTGFPYARSILAVWSRRTVKKETSETIRHFISSLNPDDRTLGTLRRLARLYRKPLCRSYCSLPFDYALRR